MGEILLLSAEMRTLGVQTQFGGGVAGGCEQRGEHGCLGSSYIAKSSD